jgi:hypothetical protein
VVITPLTDSQADGARSFDGWPHHENVAASTDPFESTMAACM